MRPRIIEPIPNKAPIEEVEVYRGLILQVYAQLGILKMYDEKFIFLEEQMHIHLLQLGATLDLMKTEKDNDDGLAKH